jgi:hypothetical protein
LISKDGGYGFRRSPYLSLEKLMDAFVLRIVVFSIVPLNEELMFFGFSDPASVL